MKALRAFVARLPRPERLCVCGPRTQADVVPGTVHWACGGTVPVRRVSAPFRLDADRRLAR